MIIFQKFIKREDLRANPSVLYVFGDNDERTGFGGQAKEMRGEPNAVGVRTKFSPHNSPSAYYTDHSYENNIAKIDEDFKPIISHLRNHGVVVFPLDGLGTGLAKLPISAPRTYAYLNDKVVQLLRGGFFWHTTLGQRDNT